MEKLMLEMMSPNVSTLLPIGLGIDFSTIDASRFKITPRANGIFELDYLESDYNSSYISACANNAFDIYKNHIYDVNVTGLKAEVIPAAVGSQRFCTMDYGFAEFLTKVIKHRSVVDLIKDENGNWMEMLNVSQYFRFMRYTSGGQHFPHYDSDFEYAHNGAITKYSLVAYFTKCHTGEIAFVNHAGNEFEGQVTDWNRQATNDEIYLKILPAPLKIVVFPHTLCHTVLPYTDKGSQRIICRGDILYKKV